MKQSSTLFLKVVIYLIAIGTLAVCGFVLPAIIRSDETGYYGPILIGMYATVIPFFVALYQALKLLGYIDANKAFSNLSIRALKHIKYCAVIISLLYIAGLPFIYSAADKDDAPGAMVIGLVFVAVPFVVAVFAAVLQKLIQNGVDIKSENDLTV